MQIFSEWISLESCTQNRFQQRNATLGSRLKRAEDDFMINVEFFFGRVSQCLENFQGRWRQEYCLTIRPNGITDIASMEKIYKQAITHIYRRKYHQFFNRLLVEFREDLACFKSTERLLLGTLSLHANREVHTPLDPQVQMMFAIFVIFKFFVNWNLAHYTSQYILPLHLNHKQLLNGFL